MDLVFCESHLQTSVPKVPYLLREYRKTKRSSFLGARKLLFQGVGDRDVYNPTKPFEINNIRVIAARVESRDSEASQVILFKESQGRWSPLDGAPIYNMQDPFFTFIDHELILGGVETFPKSQGGLGYKTVFYRGKTLETLKPFAEGPTGMKDIRLVELKEGRIGVFTRPQGRILGTDIDGGKGKIGFTIVNSLQDLNPENIIRAPLMGGQFDPAEWGGVNEAQVLPDGNLAVLGHVARFDSKGNRHYYPATFRVDLTTGRVYQFKVIFERANLTNGLQGSSKRDDLRDVVFSGGFELIGNEMIIYVGAGDAEAYFVTVKNPFLNKTRN